jgi:hypothetical protein
LRDAWPDDRARGHKGEVVVYLQLDEQHAHGRRLYVKTTQGPTVAQELCNFWILCCLLLQHL